jgi:hypothetical protein
MKIELTRGMVTEIDDEDWDLIRGYRWKAHNSKGSFYAISQWEELGEKKHILMHRLLLGLSDPVMVVDHIDGDRLNNRRANLRVCTQAENLRNSKLRSHSSTRVRNVQFYKDRYRARVTLNGKTHTKWFRKIDEASDWAKAKRIELHGEFAYVENSNAA